MSKFYHDENQKFIILVNFNLLRTQLNNRIVQQLLETETSNTLIAQFLFIVDMCVDYTYVD